MPRDKRKSRKHNYGIIFFHFYNCQTLEIDFEQMFLINYQYLIGKNLVLYIHIYIYIYIYIYIFNKYISIKNDI